MDFSSSSTLTLIFFQFEYILFELLGGRSSQPFDWLPFGEWEKCRSEPRTKVHQEYVLHLPVTPVWIGLRVLEVRHRAVFYSGWCDGVMDSACDFDLLGE